MSRESPLRREISELLWLAMPLVAGQAGSNLMSLVDTAMVGRLGAPSLAGLGIGNMIFFSITILGIGCVLGMDPLVSQAVGAGEEERARRVLWQGVRVALLVGTPLTILAALSPFVVAHAGVDPSVAGEVRRFLHGRCLNAVPLLVEVALRSYLQAHGRTRPVLVAVAVANIVNFVGNALLIYGDGALQALHLPAIGLPALGAMGSGLSSTLASTASMIVCARAISSLPRGTTPGDRSHRAVDLQAIGAILRVGLPAGLQLLAEVGAFAIMSVLAGRMGPTQSAAYQLALALASFSFIITVGVGAATSVRVGLHIGRDDGPGARRAGFTGFGVGACFMAVAGAAFLLIPAQLARILSDDPQVIAAAVPLLRVAGLFQVADGAQAVGAGALRGAGDTVASFLANVIGHYLVGVPLAILLGFVWHRGTPGLWLGLYIGLTTVAAGLFIRFAWRSARGFSRV